MLIAGGLLTAFIVGMVIMSVVATFEGQQKKVPVIAPVTHDGSFLKKGIIYLEEFDQAVPTDDQILDWVTKEGQPRLVQGLKELDEEMDYDKELFV